MPVMLLSGLGEMDSLMISIAGMAIVIALIPLLAWAFGRLGNAGFKVWEDQKNEIDNTHLQHQLNQKKPNLITEMEQSERRGHYDLAVEALFTARRPQEARELCELKLAAEDLPEAEREMYERYIRVIDEQF